MSDFGVTLERIEKVWEHPNADRLELAKVEAFEYQFVVPKGMYKAGDEVLYFPIDSLLPDELAEKLGVKAYLAGKQRNRVKTAKLRGAISQGMVATPESCGLEVRVYPAEMYSSPEGIDYAMDLGVTKWEPEPVMTSAGNLLPLPAGFEVYDIQNAERYRLFVDELSKYSVLVTEKLEGSHFSASLFADNRFIVCQRRAEIVEADGKRHQWWELARKLLLNDRLQDFREMVKTTKGWFRNENPQVITIRGEVIGPKVQGNYYDLEEAEVRFFDLDVDGRYLSGQDFLKFCEYSKLPQVPTLHVGSLADYLDGRSLAAESNGTSRLHPQKLREGIVIRPLYGEQQIEGERLIIKQRSPEYLAATDN